jgi:predicted outer membrane protein
MKRSLLLTLVSLVVASGTFAWAAEPQKPANAAELFVSQVTQGALAIGEMSQLAQTRSSDPSVQAFAAASLRDYEKVRQQLGSLAKRKNLTFPTQLDDEHARIVHSVSAKPPSEFDAEYAKQVTDAHAHLRMALSDASALSDKELVAFAQATIPKVNQQERLLSALPAKMPAAERTIGIGPGGSRAVTPGAANAGEVDVAPETRAAPGNAAADAAAADASAAAAEAAKHPPADAAASERRKKP